MKPIDPSTWTVEQCMNFIGNEFGTDTMVEIYHSTPTDNVDGWREEVVRRTKKPNWKPRKPK